MRETEKNSVNQGMSPVRRWSGLYTVGLMLLLLVFFAYHQWKRSGFFTPAFGPAEMMALYLPIVGSLWLLISFPFDFAHLADVLPLAIQFALAWFTNNIGRIVLLLQIIIGFISALSSAVSYFRDRDRNLTRIT
jgi:hypothetical protein